jgi:CRP-like cAMP-binding protein
LTTSSSLVGPIIHLSGVGPFHRLTHRQLSLIALQSDEVFIEAGSWLIPPGERARALYLVIDGYGTRGRDATPFGAGALIGFPGLLTGGSVDGGVRADTDLVALRLATDELRDLCERDFGILSTLLVHLAERVDDDSESYERIVAGPPGPFSPLPLGPLDRVSRMLALHRAVTLPVSSMDALAELAGRVDQLSLGERDVVWDSDSRSSEFHVVATGSLSMTRRDGGTLQLGPGALPGLPEALADRPRRRELRAAELTTLLTVSSDAFLDLLEDHFELAFSVLGALATGAAESGGS